MPPTRVIQAYFPGGQPPAHLVTRSYPSAHGARVVAPHAATVQRAVAPHAATIPAARPPHPATIQRATALQKKSSGPAARPPHQATVQRNQPGGPTARPPHQATVQRNQPGGPAARPPHQATVQRRAADPPGRPPHPAQGGPPARKAPAPHPAQRAVAGVLAPGQVHAFRTPEGFLDGSQGQGTKELPALVRHKMETFFESDFSEVRVHVGPEAPAIGAIAFTIGTDIYFAPGQFEPDTQRGQELLGHELTHVVQQREGRVENPFSGGVAVVQDSDLEDEAERMGKLVAAQAKASPLYRRECQRARRSPSPAADREGAEADETEPPSPPRGRGGPSAQRSAGGYQLVVGAYMHDNAKELPEQLAGHAFVALEGPGGDRQAWGFSPANFGSYDPTRDLGKLSSGVEGVVHDDAGALAKPGVKTRAYEVSPEQAQAALAKVREYQAGKYQFSLKDRQCSAFAVDVLDAARIDELDGLGGKPPRAMYRKL